MGSVSYHALLHSIGELLCVSIELLVSSLWWVWIQILHSLECLFSRKQIWGRLCNLLQSILSSKACCGLSPTHFDDEAYTISLYQCINVKPCFPQMWLVTSKPGPAGSGSGRHPQDQHSLPTALLVLLFWFSLLEILLLACLGFGLEVVVICMFMISWPRLSGNCNSCWTSMSLWFVAFTMPRYLKSVQWLQQ